MDNFQDHQSKIKHRMTGEVVPMLDRTKMVSEPKKSQGQGPKEPDLERREAARVGQVQV